MGRTARVILQKFIVLTHFSENLTFSLRKAVQLGTSYLRQLNDSFKKNGFDGLAKTLGDELGDAVTKISDKIPDFINIGSSIVKSFMKGISNNSEILAKSVSEIVTSLVNGILDLFPQFLMVGSQLVSSFADGISEKLPVLTEKAVNIIEWISEKIDERQKNYQDLRENAKNTADENFAPVERACYSSDYE